jgi:hypothetical protein
MSSVKSAPASNAAERDDCSIILQAFPQGQPVDA